MTSTQSHILGLLKGASSKAPIPLHELVTKSGLLEDTLLTILDSMSEGLPALVCSAVITKYGVTTTVFWPTCVIESENWKHKEFVVSPTKHTQTTALPPPRRHELTQKSETDMAAKFPALMIVTHVSKNPGVSHSSLVEQLAGNDVRSQELVKQMLYYCVKQNFLEARMVGGVKTYDLGLNEAWLAQHDLLPATKPKESTESGVETSTVKPAAQQTSPEAEGTASAAESTVEPQPKPEIVLPIMNRVTAIAVPQTLDNPSFLPDEQDEEVSTADVAEARPEASQYGHFRVAYHSDGSLALHGLSFAPVELDKDQLDTLIDFLDVIGLTV